MPRIARFILIDAPIAQIFAFVADYRNLPRIQAEFKSVRLLSAQATGPGAQVEARGSFRGFPLTAHMTVIQAEPPHLLVSDTSGGVRSRSIWRFSEQAPPDPAAAPRVRVSLAIEYELLIPGLALLGGLVQRDLDGMTTDALRRLSCWSRRPKNEPAGG